MTDASFGDHHKNWTVSPTMAMSPTARLRRTELARSPALWNNKDCGSDIRDVKPISTPASSLYRFATVEMAEDTVLLAVCAQQFTTLAGPHAFPTLRQHSTLGIVVVVAAIQQPTRHHWTIADNPGGAWC